MCSCVTYSLLCLRDIICCHSNDAMTQLQHSQTHAAQIFFNGRYRWNKTKSHFQQHHLDCVWAVMHYSASFGPAAMQIRQAACAITTHLSMESTISSTQALILFCASRWVMLSVGSPSMAMIMSPMQRLAWAALLPGVTYKEEDMAGK